MKYLPTAYIAIVVTLIAWGVWHIQPAQVISESVREGNFKWQGHTYSGWQMGCNYALGSNADWNEKLQRYGDQKYLDCANGMVYVVVGESPSSSYFDPKDKVTNARHCKTGEVATFNYDNPLTSENEEGTFNDCMAW